MIVRIKNLPNKGITNLVGHPITTRDMFLLFCYVNVNNISYGNSNEISGEKIMKMWLTNLIPCARLFLAVIGTLSVRLD